jgi:hypothetical protein
MVKLFNGQEREREDREEREDEQKKKERNVRGCLKEGKERRNEITKEERD